MKPWEEKIIDSKVPGPPLLVVFGLSLSLDGMPPRDLDGRNR